MDNKKSFKIWKIFLVLFILSIIMMIVYFAVFMLKPKLVVANGLDKFKNYLTPVVEPLYVDYKLGDKFSITNKTTFDLTSSSLSDYQELVNNSEINFNYIYNKTDKKSFIDMDTNIFETSIALDYYIDNIDNYLYLYDIYSKYIKLDIDYNIFNDNITKDNIIYIYNKILDSIKNNIDDSLFERSINFNNGPTVIATLNLTNQDYINLIKKVRDEVLSDSKVIEILSIVYNQEDIDDIRNSQIDADFDSISLSVKQSIIKDNLQSVELVIDRSDNITKLVGNKDDNKLNIVNYYNDKKVYNIDITINDKNFNLEYTNSNNNITTLSGTASGNYYTYTMSIPIDSYYIDEEDDENKNITISYTFNNIVSDNLTYNNIIGVIYDDFNLSIKSQGIVSNIANDINVDVSDYQEYDDVDTNEIYNNLVLKLSELSSKVSMID